MQDRVAEVLAQRSAMDRDAGIGFVLSFFLHAGLAGAAVYAAFHAPAPEPARMVSIQFATMPAAAPPAAAVRRRETPAAPKVEAPKITEPKPVVEKKPDPVKPPEKNTVPLSPFGRSTKKGSEAPAPPPPAPAAPAGAPGVSATGADVAVGGSGVTGLEGGDFPYALYLQGMHRKIGSNWFRPQTGGGDGTVVYFRIQRDGTISEARIHQPSGNGTFDRAALSAVRSSSPLNTLPFAYSGSYLGVYLTFR